MPVAQQNAAPKKKNVRTEHKAHFGRTLGDIFPATMPITPTAVANGGLLTHYTLQSTSLLTIVSKAMPCTSNPPTHFRVADSTTAARSVGHPLRLQGGSRVIVVNMPFRFRA